LQARKEREEAAERARKAMERRAELRRLRDTYALSARNLSVRETHLLLP
jgi:hypothetical protein